MSELNIASNKAVTTAINIYEWINDLFKSFGIVGGGMAASAADWVFGAVTMSVLLSNYTGFQYRWVAWVIGVIFSMALWGTQLILWQTILTGKISKISSAKETTMILYVVTFIGIAIMKFGDDFSDIVGVYWLIRDNPMQAVLAVSWYKTLVGVIFFLTWSICGFSEVFMALSINLLKKEDKPNQKPQSAPFQPPNKNHGNGFKRREDLEKGRHAPTYRPTYMDNESLNRLAREVMKENQNKRPFGE